MPPTSSTPPTTPKRRPATKAESDRILAAADRLNPESHRDSVEELLPPEYFADFQNRERILRQLQGGEVRHLAVQAAIAQLHEDARCGLLTVPDSASE